MAHTEAQIRRAIKPLLTVYGELNTSEVKNLLHTVLTFDAEDNIMSKTRKETLIIQRIGNIVAHQADKIKVYDEGFIVDKNYRPARFILFNPITSEPIQSDEVTKIKGKTKRFIARKVDWEKLRDRNNEIGDQGEEFVLEFEIDRLVEVLSIERPKAMQNVQHLSRLQGDGLGYDIYSINNDGSPRYIEVKTTGGDFNQPFFMSENERRFFEEYKDSAFIYRVYNFNRESRHGEIRIITSEELFTNFNFDTTTWKVTPK
ncbi:DUF3883 domain-containing protein [Ornithobacterium rhinotracheale]|uniref:DUF3883 domain-containing protein n=1 Tax=Ornithobacterium rhinotracheale TaxID=28251 RepID=UPI001FF15006|nr:DUF3883 domain-containing protein [Ornithobacterium rhinotracheale]MCK0202184.1 DUF3883 domain-containing protein [Ornithobacterium rhinotracheale]